MKAKKFDALPKTDAGLPVVTLMSNPDLSPSSEGFLSAVNKGANGRTIRVVKSEEMPEPVAKAEDLQPELEVTLDLGQTTTDQSFFRKLFGGFFASPPQNMTGTSMGVSKDAISFDAAVAVPKLFDRLWDGYLALEQSIGSIMHDEEIRDKQAAVETVLTQYTRFVSAALDVVPVMKTAQAKKSAEVMAEIWPTVRHESTMKADGATIAAARDALTAAGTAIDALVAVDKSEAPAATEDDVMEGKALDALATQAANTAMQVAKSVDPSATATQLIAVGVAAAGNVYKAAVSGPSQPGIPTTALQQQLSESKGMTGSPKDPFGQFTKAINGLTSLTSKTHKALTGDLDDAGNLVEGGDPGLIAVVKAQGDALEKMGQRVNKMAGTPGPSRVIGGGGAKVPVKEPVAKSDDDVFEGSALSFN